MRAEADDFFVRRFSALELFSALMRQISTGEGCQGRETVKISQKGLHDFAKQVIISVSFEKSLWERSGGHVQGGPL
jgi:hypothetical protein